MTLRNIAKGIVAAGLTISFQFAMGQIPLAQQATPQAAPPVTDAPRPNRGPVDSRVQQRTYTFADTNEQMPYALFVSSKVTRDKKNPLIVSLHGLGGDQNTMVRESLRSVELAEQGGTSSWRRWDTTPEAGTASLRGHRALLERMRQDVAPCRRVP